MKKTLGLALCGSYCTYEAVFAAASKLTEDYRLVPIMSETASHTDTRFGTAEAFLARLEALCGCKPVTSIAEAEPLGPKEPMDALLIAPMYRQYPGKAFPRTHGQLRCHGGQGPSAQWKTSGDRLFHQ